MEIEYKNRKLEKNLNDPVAMKKEYGTMAKKVNQRMKELKASDNLSVLSTIPAAKFHDLKGNRKGEFSVSISGNFRIIFIPYHDPLPKNDDGSLDLKSISRIKIIETGDYH